MRIIANKKVDMTDQEWAGYLELVKNFSDNRINAALYFKDLFETDEKGHIVFIRSTEKIPYAIIFFIQNLMINQRLDEVQKLNFVVRKLNDKIDLLVEKINTLENKLLEQNNE